MIKTLWMVMAMLMAAIAPGFAADLVANGDFSKGVAGWHLVVSDGYAKPDPEFHVSTNTLVASGLHAVSPPYLILMQAVDIRKSKRYRLSYDIKGGTGRYVVSVQHIRREKHVNKEHLITNDWQSVTLDFTGAFDTDSKWVRQYRRAAEKSKLDRGWKPNRDMAMFLAEKDREEASSRTMLVFSLGAIDGSMELRKVSIIELE